MSIRNWPAIFSATFDRSDSDFFWSIGQPVTIALGVGALRTIYGSGLMEGLEAAALILFIGLTGTFYYRFARAYRRQTAKRPTSSPMEPRRVIKRRTE